MQEECISTVCNSICLLAYMLRVPDSGIIKTDLAGTLMRLLQGEHFLSLPGVSSSVTTALYRYSALPAGRLQLLQQLTPAGSAAMVDKSLQMLEDRDSTDPGGLLVAAGSFLAYPIHSCDYMKHTDSHES